MHDELAKADCLDGNALEVSHRGTIRQVCEESKIRMGLCFEGGCIYSREKESDGGGWTASDLPNFSFRSPPCLSFYSGSKAARRRGAGRSLKIVTVGRVENSL